MDNTLLSSRIDFPAMKMAVYTRLAEDGLLEPSIGPDGMTTSQLIVAAQTAGRMSQRQLEELWALVARFETEGMHGAGLEPEAAEVLEELERRGLPLAVLTNNAREAALTALAETGIAGRFRHIAGREQMEALKPSPSGLLRLHRLEPHIPAGAWLFVGDSWIDGQCAVDAGSPFAAYQAEPDELARRGIEPIARLCRLSELLALLDG